MRRKVGNKWWNFHSTFGSRSAALKVVKAIKKDPNQHLGNYRIYEIKHKRKSPRRNRYGRFGLYTRGISIKYFN